jgi:TPR repeat protein
MRRPCHDARQRKEGSVMSATTGWLSAHGRLWYDDQRYRQAWLVWPQALIAALVLLFWASPPAVKNIPWAKPADNAAREQHFMALRDKAKSDRQAMEQLEREAKTGDMSAQFYYATLLDPDLKLSTIVAADFPQSLDWYSRSAAQGYTASIGNMALIYSDGIYTRIDFTRACFYARKLENNAYANSVRIKADCYARGLGGTTADLTMAAAAYEAASNNGNMRSTAALGYFYENGVGGKARDPAMAVKLYRAAADKGDSLGLHNLGFAYNAGTIVQRDSSEAARLIYRALQNKYDLTYQSLAQRPQLWTADFWQSLQHRLAEGGVYSGPVDGRPNPATLEAVRRLAGQ